LPQLDCLLCRPALGDLNSGETNMTTVPTITQ